MDRSLSPLLSDFFERAHSDLSSPSLSSSIFWLSAVDPYPHSLPTRASQPFVLPLALKSCFAWPLGFQLGFVLPSAMIRASGRDHNGFGFSRDS